MDYSPRGSSVHGILQIRILEWSALPFSRDLPDSGIEFGSPALQADSLLSDPSGKPLYMCVHVHTHTHKTLKVISAGPLIFFFFSSWVHSRIALLSLLQVKYDHVSPSVSKMVWITSRQKLKSPLTILHALFLSILTAVFWKAVVAVLLKPH